MIDHLTTDSLTGSQGSTGPHRGSLCTPTPFTNYR